MTSCSHASRCWDTIKEDIYVRCFACHTSPSSSQGQQDHRPGSQQSFSDWAPVMSWVPITSRLGPPPERATLSTTSQQICRQYKVGKYPQGDGCLYAHICWTSGCREPHPGKGCPQQSAWALRSSATFTTLSLREQAHTSPWQGLDLQAVLRNKPRRRYRLHGATRAHGCTQPLSAHMHPYIIQAQLQKEVDVGRIRGPFTIRPLPSLRYSGLGIVPKKENKWWMILHLSVPFGSSINDFISKESFSLHYSSMDDAVRFLVSLGPGARMAKDDHKSAFCMVPVHPQDWELLGMRWQGAYYFDTCLIFGLRSAPYLFKQYADDLQWILRQNYGLPYLLHYLDDYFIAGPCHQSPLCAAQFLQVCGRLSIPNKVDGPATTLTFLGRELDSVQQQIRLPPDKLDEILTELHDWWSHTEATKRALLSHIGKLSFAARAVPAGRLFLRRLITLSTTVHKLHHHIRLGRQAQADLTWWVDFLHTWNGTTRFINPCSVPWPVHWCFRHSGLRGVLLR